MGKPPFQKLVDSHGETILRFLRRMLPAAEADDAAQETFLAALRSYPDFDGRNERAWLLMIARRKAIDELRRRRRRAEEELDDEAVAGAVAEPEAGGEAWQRVGELPDKQRAAMVLRFALDLRYREIGAALDCSEAAARRNVHEGLTKLRASYMQGPQSRVKDET